jgi:hypothetical protein
MQYMRKNERGFTPVELLLLLVIVVIIAGSGWYVYHSQKQTNKSLDRANKTLTDLNKQSSTPAAYIEIKEWGVWASYTGKLHLSYTIEGPRAMFSSQELAAVDSSCAGRGGWIVRFAPSDLALEGSGEGDPTAAEFFPTQDKSTYAHIGNYYYAFGHAQSACGKAAETFDLQQQTNNATKALVPLLEAIPTQ